MDRRFDLLRVLASLMVVLVHISGADIHAFGSTWWAANFYDSLARACVPIFFMISGATLLGKSEPLLTFFEKRFFKVIPPLIVWSVFYLWWLWYNGAAVGGWFSWTLAILHGPTMFHLWFFYAIIGLYLFVPAMRRLYQGSTRAERLLLVSLWFIWVCIYPMAHTLLTGAPFEGPSNNAHSIGYFAPYAGYLMLGAVLTEMKWSKSIGFFVFLSGVFATACGTWLRSKSVGQPIETLYLYLSPTVAVSAVGLYGVFLGVREGKSSPLLREVADCTVGVYGLHPFIIDPVFTRLELTKLTGVAWIDIPLATIGVFTLTLVVIFLLRKVRRIWAPQNITLA